MQELNNAFRGIDRTTDVLSFDAGIPVKIESPHHSCGAQEPVLGDIVINTRKALSRSLKSGVDFYDETRRLLVHGILHLLGYNHEQRQEAIEMRKKERDILSAFKKTR